MAIVAPMPPTSTPPLDPQTTRAVRAFLRRLPATYRLQEAYVYGSRARGTPGPDSDVDLALVLEDPHGDRAALVIELAALAFHVQLDTGLMVEALPLWAEEFAAPQRFSNPALVDAIRREGVKV